MFNSIPISLLLAGLSSANTAALRSHMAYPPGHLHQLGTSSRAVFFEQFTFASDLIRSSIAGYSPASPWVQPPECLLTNNGTASYCVYSSRGFAGGRGVSILTSPDTIEDIQHLQAFTDGTTNLNINKRSQPPPFEERQLQGRGVGLIANRTIHRGDRIFAHSAVLLLDEEAWENLEDEEWVDMAKKAVNNLPTPTRKLFMDLHGHEGVDPVSDRINTNAFEVEIGEETFYAVFPEIARLNHDCRPNAAYFFDEETLTHYVHATTTISPGTEITITYIDPHMRRRQRLSSLHSSWGFNCTCSLCSMHRSLTAASDLRLRQIVALTERFEERPETASLEMAEALISLYKQERLHAPVSGAYRFAALASCAMGQRWKVLKYAQLALEIGLLDDGFSNDYALEMRKLALQPQDHGCWMAKRRTFQTVDI